MKKLTKPNVLIFWYVIVLAYASLFTFGLADSGRGPIFPDILRDYHLTDFQGGLFWFTASTAALVNNLLLFRLMERKGSYWCLQVYSLAQAAGLLMVAFAPSFPVVLIGCIFFGTSFGGLGIAHNVLVSDAAPDSRRRQLLAGLHSTYGVASLSAPLFVTFMYELGYGWRNVVAVFSAGPALVLLASFWSRKDRPVHISKAEEFAKGPLPRKAAILYSCIITGYVVAEISLSSRLALLVRRDWGFSVESANWMVAGFFFGLFIGRVYSAVVPMKTSDTRVLAVSLVASLVTFSLGLLHHPLWLSLTGLAMSMFYPVAFSMVKHETGRFSGYITSWCITVQALGLMMMHIVMGGVSDIAGLGRALWIGPVCLAFALVCLLYKQKVPPSFPV